MKILYYSKPYFGDCDFPLIKAMRAQGHDVTVIFSMTPHSLKTNVFNIKKIYPKNGIFPISIYPELTSFANYLSLENIYIANDITGKLCWESVKLSLKVIGFFRKGNYDIIQYVDTPSISHFIPLYYFRKRLVVTIHDGIPHTGEGKKTEMIIRKLTKCYIQKYIVLNKAEIQVFSEGFRIPLNKIFSSHLGYYEMLKMYGDENKKKENYILFFGRLSPYKGVEYLLHAMKQIHKTHPNVKVIIAGGGRMYFDVSQFEGMDYIEFRNYFIELEELANLIRGALFTVCPYTDATQSGVVNSSFALNTPVIATRVGGLPEMIDDGETGILVPPKDVKALAMAIKLYLDNPDYLYQTCRNIAESSTKGKGSWNKIAKEYIEIYKR